MSDTDDESPLVVKEGPYPWDHSSPSYTPAGKSRQIYDDTNYYRHPSSIHDPQSRSLRALIRLWHQLLLKRQQIRLSKKREIRLQLELSGQAREAKSSNLPTLPSQHKVLKPDFERFQAARNEIQSLEAEYKELLADWKVKRQELHVVEAEIIYSPDISPEMPMSSTGVEPDIDQQKSQFRCDSSVDESTICELATSSENLTTARGFRNRRGVDMLLNGRKAFVGQDSGGCDTISAEFAAKCGLSVETRLEEDKVSLRMGNGRYLQTIGRVFVRCQVIGGNEPEEGRWFHVVKKSVAPIMIGLEYIVKAKILTEMKHLLKSCPVGFMKSVPMLKYMGSQATINFTADGRNLVGCADTGSDLNFMSLRSAVQKGFRVDRRHDQLTTIMLPDGSEVITTGTVTVSNMNIKGFDGIPMTFHVLQGLPFDVIFGHEFLDDIDAFNTCCELIMLDVEFPDFNTLINLGPLQAWLTRALRKKKKQDYGARQRHDDMIDAEHYHRNRKKRDNNNIEDADKRCLAQAAEARRIREFDRHHRNCPQCN
ncbi:hypothetical protein GLAREA_12167 [Glarea lozoyensis ATCC 20868]|uniref:Uncharacterized protein n=1 Tax=Glarea lozoyensis (strain ATCC 20868 / MF5171) TaxID=1116229 RepID=S3D2M9_GLAL2|nr:uncharacterized protein GLAREA_12167 [Glarea lozoyensis ATCC 20868]EPE32085.1 hypothetical protein GLAREA_12167 [Glarea lozoyensis ATCC 20868]